MSFWRNKTVKDTAIGLAASAAIMAGVQQAVLRGPHPTQQLQPTEVAEQVLTNTVATTANTIQGLLRHNIDERILLRTADDEIGKGAHLVIQLQQGEIIRTDDIRTEGRKLVVNLLVISQQLKVTQGPNQEKASYLAKQAKGVAESLKSMLE